VPIDLTHAPLPEPDRAWQGIPIWHVTVKDPPERIQSLIRVYRDHSEGHWVYVRYLHFYWLKFRSTMDMLTNKITGKHHAAS